MSNMNFKIGQFVSWTVMEDTYKTMTPVKRSYCGNVISFDNETVCIFCDFKVQFFKINEINWDK